MYLTYQHYSTASKNKLEEEFFQHLKSIDRMLISEDKIEFFKEAILLKYDDLCKEYPRCKPIEKRFYCHNDNDMHLLGSNASFTILKSK